MRQSHNPRRFITLLLAGAALAACGDQPAPDLPTAAHAPAGADGLAPLVAAGAAAVPGRYIVVLHGGEQSTAAAMAREVTAAHGGRVHHTYEAVLNGFAASLPPAAVDALRRNPHVSYVAEDAMTYPDQVTQPGATWGLDRVDQRDLPLNSTYVYGRTGAGVRVYVIDSGILTSHTQFGGRASVGTDFVNDGRNGQDCNGHGTHVAGTIAGSTYGVAKAAQVISVRVFPCAGGTTTSTVIAAADWVRLNAVKPAVVNYSGGGGYNLAHNQAVQALIASGVTYVTAAGNAGGDACSTSPASTPEALTVASTDSNDGRSWFSNYGTCVDLFAPGGDITSAWYTSTTAVNTISGTSMAAPHVSGAAALYLQGAPAATPATVGAQILATSTLSKVANPGTNSPNRLLFSRLSLPAAGPVIGLNPGVLAFTFVRTVGGTPAQTGQGTDNAVRQTFAASGEGEARTAPAAAGDGEAATATSLVLTRGVVLSNTGTAALGWTAASNRPWLTVDPAEGTVNTGFTARVNATVNAAGLAAGSHTGAVVVAGGATTAPLNVTVSVTDALALVPGTPRTGLAGAVGSSAYFVVTVPPGAASLTFSTFGGTGDADLYVRYGDVPTGELYDCRPYIGGNVENCQVSNPLPGDYYVMLRGFSSYSGVTLSAGSGGAPAAPAGLSAQPASTTSIRLAWSDGSVNETGFPVSRRALSPAGTWGAWADAGTAAANAVSFVSTGLAAGTTYQFRLRACNAAGCSAWVAGAPVGIPAAAPAAPFSLLAAATSGTVARLTWTDGSSDEASFGLMRALRNTDGTWGAYAAVGTLAANTATHDNGGLLPGRQYRYQLRACNTAGCSAWVVSNVVVMPAAPAAPPAVSGTAVSINTVRVQWTDGSSNESSFGLERAPVSTAGVVGAFVPVATLAPNQVLYANAGLAPGTYRFRVRACNAAGCSAWTTSASVVIPPVPAAPAGLAGAALSAASIRLTWTDGPVETTYQVYRSLRNLDGTWPAYAAVGTLAANTAAYTNAGLLSARTYRYQVRACNSSGCSPWATSAIITTP